MHFENLYEMGLVFGIIFAKALAMSGLWLDYIVWVSTVLGTLLLMEAGFDVGKK